MYSFNRTSYSVRHLILMLGMVFVLPSAFGQSYPTRPIKLIIPYPAGGTLDLVGREIGKMAEPDLGQPVVADNVSGATGVIAHTQIARAAADGYTIGISGLSPLALAPHQYKNLSYQPLKDFSFVSCFGDTPLVLNVSASLPVKNIHELVAYAKANPGKLNYGSAGVGNASFLAAAMFAKQAGIDIKHVPYKGNAPAMVDLVGGHIQILFDPPQTTLPQVAAGKIRPLAVTSRGRFPGLPDVPTVAESGWNSYEFSIWYTMIAPAGVPDGIIAKLSSAINKVVSNQDIKRQFSAKGSNLYESTPQSCDTLVKREYNAWKQAFSELNIKSE